MQRRDFLRSAGVVGAGLALPRLSHAFAATPEPWRTFEVVSRVEVLAPSGVTRIGRRLLVRRDDLLSWLDERRAASPGGTRR